MYQLQQQKTRPQITAHLAQTMNLLVKTVQELGEEIDKELATNPALEMNEEIRCPLCNRPIPVGGYCPVCTKPKTMSSEETVVFISPRVDFIPESDRNEETDEPSTIMLEELPVHVFKQIAPDLPTEDREIASFLLNQLDEDGLLIVSLSEVSEYFHVPIERVMAVQNIIQRADPIGVSSISPQQALLVQVQILSEFRKIPEFTQLLIEDGFELICHLKYRELSKKLSIPLQKVKLVGEFIKSNLNPYPARSHWGNVRQPAAFDSQTYMQPDVIISYLNNNEENPLMVEVILPVRGTLQINPLFKKAIVEADEDKRGELKGDLEKASLFIKCLQQRNNTMQKLLEKIVSLQKGYIRHGEMELRPITRAELSKELEVHESTISRAVSNKSVRLPSGQIIPMSNFFIRNLNIRAVIREMIANEKKPLSDITIVGLLKKRGINVARRTVAKYRALEGILPAHMRKKVKEDEFKSQH